MKFRMMNLAGLMLFVGLFSMSSACSNAQSKNSKLQTLEIQTSAVCGMCKQTLEKAMNDTEGISNGRLDLGNKVLTVKYDNAKISADEIRQVIANIGYDADDVPANLESHDALPACCQKDSGLH